MSKRLKLSGSEPSYLEGQLLIAMPTMTDPRFAKSVIYMCAHSKEGAMGLIINQTAKNVSFPDLLDRLEIYPGDNRNPSGQVECPDIPIHVGGPVETGRGFVLHTADYFVEDTTLKIRNEICLTATLEILKAMATGNGPRHSILALGYAGWSPGQLESEIQANGWLNCPATADIVFAHGDAEPDKYSRALAALGIDLTFLASDAGHA
ncbi:MAG: YqgE/AlgH family protein [Alphaproteobacteria bacterium]|nr:YqgE/AlgH family protein [Alphaproteobacteria bacterium]